MINTLLIIYSCHTKKDFKQVTLNEKDKEKFVKSILYKNVEKLAKYLYAPQLNEIRGELTQRIIKYCDLTNDKCTQATLITPYRRSAYNTSATALQVQRYTINDAYSSVFTEYTASNIKNYCDKGNAVVQEIVDWFKLADRISFSRIDTLRLLQPYEVDDSKILFDASHVPLLCLHALDIPNNYFMFNFNMISTELRQTLDCRLCARFVDYKEHVKLIPKREFKHRQQSLIIAFQKYYSYKETGILL